MAHTLHEQIETIKETIAEKRGRKIKTVAVDMGTDEEAEESTEEMEAEETTEEEAETEVTDSNIDVETDTTEESEES